MRSAWTERSPASGSMSRGHLGAGAGLSPDRDALPPRDALPLALVADLPRRARRVAVQPARLVGGAEAPGAPGGRDRRRARARGRLGAGARRAVARAALRR